MEKKSPSPQSSREANETEMDKLVLKLQRAYQRRDHYAQLYYKTLSELEEMKWQLNIANKKIQELSSSQNHKSHDSSKDYHHDQEESTISRPLQLSSNNHFAVSIQPNPVHDDAVFKGNNKEDFKQHEPMVNNVPQGVNHLPLTKRVSFSDYPSPVMYPSDWSPTQASVIHRSSSITEGELNHAQTPLNRMQRTQSYSSYPKGMYPHHPIMPPHFANNSAFNDHRLPRVHRSLAYETAIQYYQPPPHMQPHQQQNKSAFQRVQIPSSNHPGDYRGQLRYSSLPLNSSSNKGVEAGKRRVKNLNQAELMSLFAEISNPKMKYKKLEISSCGLGNVEIMTLLCRELKKQQMIEELSLPYNEIRKDSLKILLDTVTLCKKIKYLGLNNNEINEDCLEMIQSFISKSSHCILILNGNEVEQHAHLLEQQLLSHDNNDLELAHNVPNDKGAQDESYTAHSIYGNPSMDRCILNNSSSLPHNMKLLQI